MKNKELDNILDQVAAGIRSEQVDAAVVDDASERVWARLSVEAGARRMRADRPLDNPNAADGPVYAVADAQMRSINAREKLGRGETIRTAKDAHAVVRLSDGSTIEMKDRSEFSINQTLRGTTVHLDRGSVIVEAAKQKGRMFVDTGDSLVSVTGTTFAVNAGTKGSRVSVIEGEVHLDRNGDDKVLRAGEQVTTNPAIETVPVKEEVSWSRNAPRYSQVLDALASLR